MAAGFLVARNLGPEFEFDHATQQVRLRIGPGFKRDRDGRLTVTPSWVDVTFLAALLILLASIVLGVGVLLGRTMFAADDPELPPPVTVDG